MKRSEMINGRSLKFRFRTHFERLFNIRAFARLFDEHRVLTKVKSCNKKKIINEEKVNNYNGDSMVYYYDRRELLLTFFLFLAL